MSKSTLRLASLVVLSAAVWAASGTSLAQSPINLAPPTVLTPSTTGAQIGSFDPNALNNPNWLKPVGTVAPQAGVNFAPAPEIAVPSQSSTGAGTCALYDSWCAYCADLCKGSESSGD